LEVSKKQQLFVIKLSGSLFSSDNFRQVTLTIRDALSEKVHLFLILVAGGGATARKYIKAGAELGLDQSTLDELGIASSKLNASLLAEALYPLASRKVPNGLSDIVEQSEKLGREKNTRIVVCGGLQPGQSTNAVAALISEKTRADLLINATDVDGVYDKDPARHFDAKRFDEVTPARLSAILESESMEAGTYDLMDPIALKLISRSKIPTRIVKCDSLHLSKVLHGEKEGTEIVFQP
jgi:uridylate kinase